MVSFFFCLRIMKKIIYFISEDWVFLNHRFDLAKKIISSGFKLSLITKVSNYKKEIEEKKINVINLKTERGSLNIRKSLKDIYKIFKIYKKLKPDIVHHFGIRQIVHGNIAARLAGIKKSYNSITGLGSVFISGNIILKFFILTVLKISLLFKKSYILVQNKHDFDFVKKKLPNKNNILLPASGVDTNKFLQTKEPKGNVIFLFASRIIKDKGIIELIEATKQLKSQKKKFELYIAGSPDFQNKSTISHVQLKTWESLGYIRYLGLVKDMEQLYKKVHVGILPSYREGLPKSLLEAASSGKPIITTDVPGCNEIVKNEFNGLIVPPKDSNELMKAMKKLILNKKLRISMGKKGRELIKKNFSNSKATKDIINLYQNNS